MYVGNYFIFIYTYINKIDSMIILFVSTLKYKHLKTNIVIKNLIYKFDFF